LRFCHKNFILTANSGKCASLNNVPEYGIQIKAYKISRAVFALME
jgi:hypothetical protein